MKDKLANNPDENRELQQHVLQASDRILDYCKMVVQDCIPYLRGSESSGFKSEGEALAELDFERSKFIEVVEKALQKKQFSDAIFLARNLAIFYERRSYLDDWVEVCNYALEAAISSNDFSSKAFMLGMLSRVFRIKNMWPEAIEHGKESISIYESLSEKVQSENFLKSSKAEILDTLGNIYRSIGSPQSLEDAEKKFSESINLFHEASDETGELKALDGLAQVYTKQGKLELAKEILEKLLDRKKETRDTDFSISITLNNLGKILRDIGELVTAESVFNEALIKKKNLLDWRGEASTYHELGILKYRDGNISEAFNLFNQSLEIKRERGDSHGQGLSLVEIGNLYYKRGETIQACESWIKALVNLAKESEQYRQNEKLLLQEALGKIDFRELSDTSINILKELEMNPLQSQELCELLSCQSVEELNPNQQEQLNVMIEIRELFLLRKSQALDEAKQRHSNDQ
jgi:tetratricopeptide (TPR) repeat protein